MGDNGLRQCSPGDAPLEGAGFEPSVPRMAFYRCGVERLNRPRPLSCPAVKFAAAACGPHRLVPTHRSLGKPTSRAPAAPDRAASALLSSANDHRRRGGSYR